MSKSIKDIVETYYNKDFIPSRELEVISEDKKLILQYYNEIRGARILTYEVFPRITTTININQDSSVSKSYRLIISFDKWH